LNLIPKSILVSLNYGKQNDAYVSLFNKFYDDAFKLFVNHRAHGRGSGAFFMPKIWAPTISNLIKNLLVLDPNIKLISISERYGKLNIEFLLSDNKFEIEAMDLVYKAQIRLDNINHGLVFRLFSRNQLAVSANRDEKWLLTRGILLTKS